MKAVIGEYMWQRWLVQILWHLPYVFSSFWCVMNYYTVTYAWFLWGFWGVFFFSLFVCVFFYCLLFVLFCLWVFFWFFLVFGLILLLLLWAGLWSRDGHAWTLSGYWQENSYPPPTHTHTHTPDSPVDHWSVCIWQACAITDCSECAL